jgi:RNA polymerase sigma-70 factor (ECF subfamily)
VIQGQDKPAKTLGSEKTYLIPQHFSVVEEQAFLYTSNKKDEFTTLYNEYFSFAFFLASGFVNKFDAQDIVANVFCRLWVRRNNLNQIADIKGYIASSIRNACKDFIESRALRLNREEKWFTNIYEGDSQNHLLKNDIHAEKLSLISNEIEKLPNRCREIFKLAFIENLKNNEIARKMGITKRTVVNQKHRALKALKLTLLSIVYLMYYTITLSRGLI